MLVGGHLERSTEMIDGRRFSLLLAALALLTAATAGSSTAAECPPCPPPLPPGWRVALGGGLALTGGNTDSSSYNLAVDLVHDPGQRNVFRADGLYLRTSQEERTTVDRTALAVRDEYTLSGRTFTFGQLGYQRDRFKEVDFLITPLVGLGYNAVKTDVVLFAVDAAGGGAIERLTGQDTTTDLALQAGERVEWRFSPTARLVHRASALWKANDFGDAYYHFEVGLAAALAKRFELKVTFADDYKSRPADQGLKKNDTSVLASLVFKL
jgi:putative salt-induced outer membrane protein YdiY